MLPRRHSILFSRSFRFCFVFLQSFFSCVNAMKVLSLVLLAAVAVDCQTKNENGNPTGEIGAPAFDEIVVESTLTVRGKPGSGSGSRSGKSVSLEKAKITQVEGPKNVTEAKAEEGASVVLKRTKRIPNPQRFRGGNNRFGGFGNAFPGSSSSAAQASSNSFDAQSPFGNFGASASQSSSQSQNFGPHGFGASAGQSASQTYVLPDGNRIDVSFSGGYSTDNGRPSFSNGHSVTVTGPDGRKQKIYG